MKYKQENLFTWNQQSDNLCTILTKQQPCSIMPRCSLYEDSLESEEFSILFVKLSCELQHFMRERASILLFILLINIINFPSKRLSQ